MRKVILLILVSLLISCDFIEKTNDIQDSMLAKGFTIEGESIYFGESEFEFEKTVKLNNSALEYSRQRKFIKARKTLLKALDIEPQNPILWNNLGNVERVSPNESKAKKYFEKSIKVSDSTYLVAVLNLGILHSYSGDFDKSKKLFQYIISNSDNDLLEAISNLELTKLYIDTGNCEKAKKSFKIADKILNDLNVLKETKNDLKKFNLDYCQN
tara:strand:- start:100 stop:738 length:639 start_codon:yes stop_codon:yes gene_type:complete